MQISSLISILVGLWAVAMSGFELHFSLGGRLPLDYISTSAAGFRTRLASCCQCQFEPLIGHG